MCAPFFQSHLFQEITIIHGGAKFQGFFPPGIMIGGIPGNSRLRIDLVPHYSYSTQGFVQDFFLGGGRGGLEDFLDFQQWGFNPPQQHTPSPSSEL